jgi:hypothetical protein
MNVWSKLEHRHVLPFLGYCRSYLAQSPAHQAEATMAATLSAFPSFCFVSPWMAGGEAPGYLRCNPDVDRLKMVSPFSFGHIRDFRPFASCPLTIIISQVSEIANGVWYLHLNGIIHGDITGVSMLSIIYLNRDVDCIGAGKYLNKPHEYSSNS